MKQLNMYIYTGAALPDVLPSGTVPPRNNLLGQHDDDLPSISTFKVFHPDKILGLVEQLDFLRTMITSAKNRNEHFKLCSQNPWNIEYAYRMGHKLGFNVKVFHVIYDDMGQPIFQDPDGSDIKFLEDIIKEVGDVLQAVEALQSEE